MAAASAKRAPMSWLLILFVLLSCKPETTATLKKTIDETRSKPRVTVQIRLDKPDLPTAEELEVRRKLESDIERDHIGSVLETSAGNGYMDFTVEVDDTTTSIPRIRAVLSGAGLLNRSTIKIVSP
jgi:hypothetical protein